MKEMPDLHPVVKIILNPFITTTFWLVVVVLAAPTPRDAFHDALPLLIIWVPLVLGWTVGSLCAWLDSRFCRR